MPNSLTQQAKTQAGGPLLSGELLLPSLREHLIEDFIKFGTCSLWRESRQTLGEDAFCLVVEAGQHCERPGAQAEDRPGGLGFGSSWYEIDRLKFKFKRLPRECASFFKPAGVTRKLGILSDLH
jgi:hypothetical protein